MAEKLWDLANLITGFAVAHALTMSYAIAKHEMVSLKDNTAHAVALVLSLIFTFLYVGAIWWCYKTGIELYPKNSSVWYSVTLGRILTVGVFTLVMLLALFGHWRALKDPAH